MPCWSQAFAVPTDDQGPGGGARAYDDLRRPTTAGSCDERTNPPDAILREVYDEERGTAVP